MSDTTKHQCPAFKVKVVAIYDTGCVVETLEGGEYFNLFRGALADKDDKARAQHEFSRLSVGSILSVTCMDPVCHKHNPGPDGALRPNVSKWLAVKPHLEEQAESKVSAARVWDDAGGGCLKVARKGDNFVICEGDGFTALWHVNDMGGSKLDDLKEGSMTPALRTKENRRDGHNAYIRLRRA